jgi:hypothetical protein
VTPVAFAGEKMPAAAVSGKACAVFAATVSAAVSGKACAVPAATMFGTMPAATMFATVPTATMFATMPAAAVMSAKAVAAAVSAATVPAAMSAPTVSAPTVPAATALRVCFECEKRHDEEQHRSNASAGPQHRPHGAAGLGAPHRRGRLSLGIPPRTKSF